mmetsp:Transcript_124407/g.175525  ORF Transcript_124407/g.175525 Transcript_124407/m.175525 type:complete len:86 (+) Transcript_124407:84-341(+)
MPHGVRSPAATVDDGEVDPWEQRIESTGCATQHYALQDCYDETGDWRKCQEPMKAFRQCMQRSTKSKKPVDTGNKTNSNASGTNK